MQTATIKRLAQDLIKREVNEHRQPEDVEGTSGWLCTVFNAVRRFW
jgi:hypothetical protein